MAAKDRRRKPGQERARFVCVTRFGSHQCGSVLQLGGRQAQGGSCPGLEAQDNEEEPLPPEAAGAAAGGGAEAATSSPGPAPRGRRSRGPPARAGLIRKDADGKFDFPIPLNEASKILKKKKKVSVWNSVYKVISKMLEENEKYRLRLKCQKLSNAS